MKDLNNLVELAKKANSAGQGTPEMFEFRVAANPDTILAIAEAFRAMEQRAEAAEARIARLQPLQGCMSALADILYVNTEPKEVIEGVQALVGIRGAEVPVVEVEMSDGHWLNMGPIAGGGLSALPDGIHKLFTHPAPVVDLPELIELKDAVDFYQQVQRENPPVELGIHKDADERLKAAAISLATVKSADGEEEA